MEDLKEALQYVVGLGNEAEKTEVVEICGKTYANRDLTRYDCTDKARAITAATLSSLVDYIRDCSTEFPEASKMLIHIVSPVEVRLMSALDAERDRETLFIVNAQTSKFRYDEWYDQERFMIELQANFQKNGDLDLLTKMAGNIEKRNGQAYADDGISQVATMTVGVAAKADVIVPNPVELIPYRTFQEVAQPASKFVFRIGDKEVPAFKIVEAENNIWKNEAIANIKSYFSDALQEMDATIKDRIVIIG